MLTPARPAQLEIKVYEEEGLDITGISFSDNQPCLDMIEKARHTILRAILAPVQSEPSCCGFRRGAIA